MQELFRLHTKNEPKILNKEVVESIGIQSHPDEVQSVRCKKLLKVI